MILQSIKGLLGPTNLRHLKQKTLPFIKDSEGNICRTPGQALARWLEFFQHMEGGQLLDSLQQRRLWIQLLPRPGGATDFG